MQMLAEILLMDLKPDIYMGTYFLLIVVVESQ